MHTVPFFGPSHTPAQRSFASARILELCAAARRIRCELRSGASYSPLRDKNLALLLVGPAPTASSMLLRAATELGARVSQVRYRQPDGAAHADIAPMARTLGQMYDAIDCGCLPAATVRQIEQAAGVPVYEGLGLDSHPARILADLMTLLDRPLPPCGSSDMDEELRAENHRCVIQAVLVDTIARP